MRPTQIAAVLELDLDDVVKAVPWEEMPVPETMKAKPAPDQQPQLEGMQVQENG